MTEKLLDTHLNHFLNKLNRNQSLNPSCHLIETVHVFASVIFAPISPFTSNLNLWMKL